MVFSAVRRQRLLGAQPPGMSNLEALQFSLSKTFHSLQPQARCARPAHHAWNPQPEPCSAARQACRT